MDFVKNPQDMCKRVHKMIREITAKIRALKAELKARGWWSDGHYFWWHKIDMLSHMHTHICTHMYTCMLALAHTCSKESSKGKSFHKCLISGPCHRSQAVQWWVLGAADTALGQAGEGLPAEERAVWDQQDPRHLRLHQVRPPAQPANPAVRTGSRALHVLQSAGRHHHTPGIDVVSCTSSFGASAYTAAVTWYIMAFSLHARIRREGLINHSPTCTFFIIFFFFGG